MVDERRPAPARDGRRRALAVGSVVVVLVVFGTTAALGAPVPVPLLVLSLPVVVVASELGRRAGLVMAGLVGVSAVAFVASYPDTAGGLPHAILAAACYAAGASLVGGVRDRLDAFIQMVEDRLYDRARLDLDTIAARWSSAARLARNSLDAAEALLHDSQETAALPAGVRDSVRRAAAHVDDARRHLRAIELPRAPASGAPEAGV